MITVNNHWFAFDHSYDLYGWPDQIVSTKIFVTGRPIIRLLGVAVKVVTIAHSQYVAEGFVEANPLLYVFISPNSTFIFTLNDIRGETKAFHSPAAITSSKFRTHWLVMTSWHEGFGEWLFVQYHSAGLKDMTALFTSSSGSFSRSTSKPKSDPARP